MGLIPPAATLILLLNMPGDTVIRMSGLQSCWFPHFLQHARPELMLHLLCINAWSRQDGDDSGSALNPDPFSWPIQLPKRTAELCAVVYPYATTSGKAAVLGSELPCTPNPTHHMALVIVHGYYNVCTGIKSLVSLSVLFLCTFTEFFLTLYYIATCNSFFALKHGIYMGFSILMLSIIPNIWLYLHSYSCCKFTSKCQIKLLCQLAAEFTIKGNGNRFPVL